MCSCGEFLEIYKEDVTFRILTPDSIDPDETNPNAPWVASMVDNVGSSNHVVARILLQGRDLLDSAAFESEINKDEVTVLLHAIKEALVVCDKVARTVSSEVEAVVAGIKNTGIRKDNHGRGLNPFPQVPNLTVESSNYLIHSKRAIQLICKLPSKFLAVSDKDTNFDYLGGRLEKCIGKDAPVIKFIRGCADGVRRLIFLRNYQEHPGAMATTIKNFHVVPDGSISVPTWNLTGEAPTPLALEMVAGVQFLVQVCEAMLIHLVMHAISKKFPFGIAEIAESDVDPKRPVRYRLTLDINKLHMKKGEL